MSFGTTVTLDPRNLVEGKVRYRYRLLGGVEYRTPPVNWPDPEFEDRVQVLTRPGDLLTMDTDGDNLVTIPVRNVVCMETELIVDE